MASESAKGIYDRLVCPRCRASLQRARDEFVCPSGHAYPVVDGVPILLLEEADATGYARATLDAIRSGKHFLAPHASGIHPIVANAVVGTCGNLYRHLVGKLPRYPIPELRLLPPSDGGWLLDVGAGWGRWSLAAARRGYHAVAVDPSLELLAAAGQVAEQLGADIAVVAADATCLPFADDTFDATFSYSVLQHFDKGAARSAIREIARVTKPGGTVVVQLANAYGIRQAYNKALQALRIRDTGGFRVRYWTPREMRHTFEGIVGESALAVDGFFSLNIQPADKDLMPQRYRMLIALSEALRRASDYIPLLRYAADSLYVRAIVSRSEPS